MANGGWYGTKEQWNRLAAPLVEIDPAISRFANDMRLSVSKNLKYCPGRSISSGQSPRRAGIQSLFSRARVRATCQVQDLPHRIGKRVSTKRSGSPPSRGKRIWGRSALCALSETQTSGVASISLGNPDESSVKRANLARMPAFLYGRGAACSAREMTPNPRTLRPWPCRYRRQPRPSTWPTSTAMVAAA